MKGFANDPATAATDGDEVVFAAAGDHVKGEYRCAECGYGIVVRRDPPECPMCRSTAWTNRPSFRRWN